MRKTLNSPPTQKNNNKNQNQRFNLLNDPFGSQQIYYKSQKSNLTLHNYPSQQTDIDIDSDYFTTQRVTWNQYIHSNVSQDQHQPMMKQSKNSTSSKKHLNGNQSSQTKIQIDKSGISPSRDKKKQNIHSMRKKKQFKLKSNRLANKLEQIQQKIAKSNYPQNVMHKVYPIDNIKTVKQKQMKQKGKQINPHKNTNTKKTIKLNSIRISSQAKNLSTQNIEFNKPILTCLSDTKSLQSFQQVQLSINEAMTIQHNIKWLTRVIAQQKIQKRMGRWYLKQKTNQQILQQAQFVQQSMLQLKCMLRYRSMISILTQLYQIIDTFDQHGQTLINIHRYIEYKKYIQENNFQTIQSLNQELKSQVIQTFIKILLNFVLNYPNASKQNKEFVKKIYQRKGNKISNYKLFFGSITQIWNTKEEKYQQTNVMLQQQNIFQPYIRKIKYAKLIEPQLVKQQQVKQESTSSFNSITYSQIGRIYPSVEIKPVPRINKFEIQNKQKEQHEQKEQNKQNEQNPKINIKYEQQQDIQI